MTPSKAPQPSTRPAVMMDFPRDHWPAFDAGYLHGQRSIVDTLLADAKSALAEERQEERRRVVAAIRAKAVWPAEKAAAEWVAGIVAALDATEGENGRE